MQQQVCLGCVKGIQVTDQVISHKITEAFEPFPIQNFQGQPGHP